MRRPEPKRVFFLLTAVPLLAAAALALGLVPLRTAAAEPQATLADAQARANAVRADITRLDEEAASAVERYNMARVQLDAINARLMAARRELARAEGARDTAREQLDDRLSRIYKAEEPGLLDVIFSASDFADLSAGIWTIERIHTADKQAVADLDELSSTIARLAADIEEERDLALAREVDLRERQADIEDQLGRRKALLADLDGQIKRLIEERERREAAAARRLARRAGVDLDGINGTAAQRALVRETMNYLGIPYVWGGATPSQGFDCSGLVMYVYGKFGVRLLHGATLQARSGIPVPLSQMRPADLVFFGDSSFYRHVGIYIGKGLFIEAPRTGDVVKISRLAGRNCALACRYPIRIP